MQRRDLLKGIIAGAASSSAGLVVAQSKTSFGTPGYLANRDRHGENQLRLALSRAEIPLDVWDDIVDFQRIWSKLSADPSTMHAFYTNQSGFLEAMGIRPDLIAPRSAEEQLLLASNDPEVRRSAISSDYPAFLRRLTQLGIFSAPPSLRQRINSILENTPDLPGQYSKELQIRAQLDTEFGSELKRLKVLFSESSQTADTSIRGSEVNAVVGAVTIAVVAVAAVTYAVAAVNVAVGLNVAIQISVAVNIAITVGGGGNDGCPICHAPTANNNIDVLSAAAKIAESTGNLALHKQSLRKIVRREIIACIYAARDQGLIRLPGAGRKEIFDTLASIGYRMGGI